MERRSVHKLVLKLSVFVLLAASVFVGCSRACHSSSELTARVTQIDESSFQAVDISDGTRILLPAEKFNGDYNSLEVGDLVEVYYEPREDSSALELETFRYVYSIYKVEE